MRAFRAVLSAGAALVCIAATTAPALGAPSAGLPAGAQELASERTATSTTYALRDGSRATVLSAEPVHYRDGRRWRRIDDRLRRTADGSIVNGEGPLDVRLPTRLSTPIAVGGGGASLKMRLLEADEDAHPRLDDGVVRYDEARPGVDVAYRMSGGALKETLEVSGDDVPMTYRFALDGSDGLRFERRDDGSIAVVGEGDTTVFTIPTPVMWPRVDGAAAARAVPYELKPRGGGVQLVLRPDVGWLREHAADGGVVIDPTVKNNTATGITACSIGNPGVIYGSPCGESAGAAGWYGSVEWRLLVRFRLPEELIGTRVTSADIDLPATSTLTRGSFTAAAVIKSWDPQCVSWRVAEAVAYDDSICYFETSTWLGGQTRGSALALGTIPSYGLTGGITPIAQEWADDPTTNHGLLVMGTDRTAQASLGPVQSESSSYGATLTIRYRPDVGRPAGHVYEQRRLTDRLGLALDVGTGNLLLQTDDVRVQSRGLPFAFTRTYNSMSSRVGLFGKGWTGALGLEQRILTPEGGAPLGTNQVTFVDENGRDIFFRWGSTTSGRVDYVALTQDYSGRLARLSDGTWELVQRDGAKSTFDSGGYLTAVADKDGNATQIRYAISPKRPQTLTDSQGRDYVLAYNVDGTLASIGDETGRTWRYGYTISLSTPLLSSSTDPSGAVTSYEWGGSGTTACLSRITTPEGRTTRVVCGDENRASSITAITDARADTGDTTALSFEWNYSCTACNATSTLTDPLGHRTQYAVGMQGRPTVISYPVGPGETRAFNVAGQLTRRTIAGANWWTGYSVTDPFLPIWQQDPLSVITRTTYDSAYPNDPGQTVDELGKTVTYSYASSTGTQSAGRLTTASVTGIGAIYQYAYNGFGQLRSVTTGAGNAVVDYGYDNEGQLTSVARPSPLGTTTMTYDSLSRLRTSTDAERRTSTLTYDELDRVLSESYGDGSTISYEYDRDGNRTKQTATSAVGTPQVTRWEHDRKGRVTLETRPDGGTTRYGWDGADNLVSLTDDGGTVTYDYDAADRLTRVTEPPVGGQAQVTSFSYDAYGNRSVKRSPNGTQLIYQFNAAGRQTAMTLQQIGASSNLISRSYTYDNPDANAPQRVTSRLFSETNESGELTSYTYGDGLGRLTAALTVNRANAQIDALGYAYDARGNLTRRTQNGVTTFLGNDEASLLTGTGTVSGSWTTTFGWDAAGFLRSSTSGLNMSYNAKRQTTIAQPDGSSAATALAYAGRDQTQPTREGDDEIAYDQLGAAKRTTPSGTTYYTRTPDGEVIGERTPSGRLFPARDRQGSVLGVTDGSGRLVRSLRYDPYGRVRADSGSGQTTYGYAGGERISGNKILRFGERFYSPELMRWTQPDPLDQPESLTEANPFAYAAGDPINNTDPTGRCVWKIPCPGVAKWVLKKFTVSCLVYRSVIVRYQLTRDGYGTLRRVPVSRVVPILTTCFEYMWVKP